MGDITKRYADLRNGGIDDTSAYEIAHIEECVNDIFDCGAYAYLHNIPESMCPTGWEHEWMRGYKVAKRMTHLEKQELLRRKGR